MHRFWHVVVSAIVCCFSSTLAQTGLAAPIAAPQALAKLDSAAQYIQSRLADDVYDLEGVGQSIGPDPDLLLAFLRNEIAFRPYWGVLKGGRGVLIDRTGNALDQSVLLAQLLELHGLEVRIGYASIDAGGAARVLALGNSLVPPAPATLSMDAELLSVLLNEGGVSRSEIQELAASVPTTAAVRRAELAERAGQFLTEIGREFSPTSEFMTPPSRDSEALEMSAEYAWVEYLESDGTWRIAEPLPLGLARTAQSTAEYFDLESVPEALSHEIVVSASLVLDDGSRRSLGGVELTSIAALVSPLEMANRPVLEAPPVDQAEAIGIASEPPESLRFTMKINGNRIVDTEYRQDGTILSPLSSQEAGAKSLSGMGQALQDVGRTTQELNDNNTGALISRLELTYTLSNSKGSSRPRETRELNRTLIPHHLHAGGSYRNEDFQSPWMARLWVIPFGVDPAYYDHRALEATLAQARFIAALAEGRNVELDKPEVAMITHASPAHRVALLARAMGAQQRDGEAPFTDQMVVIVEETGVFLREPTPVATTSLDLVQISGATSVGLEPDNGVLWTLAEVMALEQTITGDVRGFLDDFRDLARSSGATLARVDTAGQAARYQPELRDSLSMEIAAGRETLVLSHNGNGVYLSRDPETGLVVGRVPGGRGLVEGAKGQADAVAQIKTYKKYADALEIGLHLIDFFVCVSSIKPGSNAEAQLVRCFWVIATSFLGMKNSLAAVVVANIQYFECLNHNQLGGHAKCMAAYFGGNVAAQYGIAGGTTEIIGSAIASGTKAAILLSDVGVIPQNSGGLFDEQEGKK